MKNIPTIILGIIIALLVVVVIALLIHCKVLEDRVEGTRVTYEAEIQELNTKKEELEEGIRTLIDQSSVTVIQGEKHEEARVEYVTKEIEKVIFTPTYSNICIDAVGLSGINTLITEDDSYTRAASEPTPTVR